MPSSYRLFLDLEGCGVPEPGHLRGFASNLFERGVNTDHHGQIKPYTVGRLVSLGGSVWSLDITIGVDSLSSLVDERIVSGTRIRLGQLSGIVAAPPATLSHRPWAELAQAPPITGVQFSFDTPVVFRRQAGQHAAPTAKLVFGHLRRRWRNLDPDTAPDVSFQSIVFALDLDGARIMTHGPGPWDPNKQKATGKSVAAFIGTATVSIVEATVSERVALGALAEAAPFLGMGSSTTSGFGAVSLLALWADD